LRLVKKLNGQPPAGAIVPSVTSAWVAPNVIVQDPAPIADRVHFPAMVTGGTVAAGPVATGELSAAGRSVLQQPASSIEMERRSAIDAVRNAMRVRKMKGEPAYG